MPTSIQASPRHKPTRGDGHPRHCEWKCYAFPTRLVGAQGFGRKVTRFSTKLVAQTGRHAPHALWVQLREGAEVATHLCGCVTRRHTWAHLHTWTRHTCPPALWVRAYAHALRDTPTYATWVPTTHCASPRVVGACPRHELGVHATRWVRVDVRGRDIVCVRMGPRVMGQKFNPLLQRGLRGRLGSALLSAPRLRLGVELGQHNLREVIDKSERLVRCYGLPCNLKSSLSKESDSFPLVSDWRKQLQSNWSVKSVGLCLHQLLELYEFENRQLTTWREFLMQSINLPCEEGRVASDHTQLSERMASHK